eukprot:TRINITY_DN17311_c0_g1_i3.p1 TRINITY_DN17311_c0_g1~~TRINITY_DN17311_c0_g1_i3.p1  ORF type:complete len:154 (+),score=19.95 TRINITY_DN17311_c0_g1_i3:99-560(+)
MVVQRCAARPRLAPGNLDDFEEQLRLAPRGGMIDPAGWKNLHKWDCWCQEPPCPQCSYDPLLPLQWAFDRENLAQASFGNQPRAHGQRCLAELPAYETPAMPLSPSAQFARAACIDLHLQLLGADLVAVLHLVLFRDDGVAVPDSLEPERLRL